MTDNRPPLVRDRSFYGIVATQFLGAFNDNVFKQLVLLLGLDFAAAKGLADDPYQTTSVMLFSLPFVLFSGFAGWLSDRYSKRRTIVLCKVAEILVMSLGALTFFFVPGLGEAQMTLLIAVLFLMGMHSAFFGPSKYGVLPELFRDRDLPIINGVVQMTTFLAIIFGTAVCGLLKKQLEAAGIGLWTVSATCIAIAVLGTVTSIMLRKTPPAQPGLPFQPAALAMDRATYNLLVGDRKLFNVMAAVVLFWFLGGMALVTSNGLGKEQFVLGDTWTSLLTACIGFGIAVGCIISGMASRTRINFRLVRMGAWGMFVSMTLLSLVPQWLTPEASILQFRRADALRLASQFERAAEEYAKLPMEHEHVLEGWVGLGLAQQERGNDVEAEAAFDEARQIDPAVEIPADPKADFAADVGIKELAPVKFALAPLLISMGMSAGLFAVPLQVYLQHRPPRELKGRMIGAMNLLTWIGILLSGAAYYICSHQFTTRHITWTFMVMAAMILPVALLYRPENEELSFE